MKKIFTIILLLTALVFGQENSVKVYKSGWYLGGGLSYPRYMTISDNVYILGFKDLITKYIIAKKEKKIFNSSGLKTVIYNSRGKTLYLDGNDV